MSDETRVLYNADCPVCNFEISHYAAYTKKQALSIRFEDLNVSEMADWGLSRDDAARRLYVLKDEQFYSGISAFIVLWRDMPRYRWIARLVDLPGIRHLAIFIYDYVLAPLIYRWHLRRQKRRNLETHL
ncbi:MAG: DUF393 domain-containing protein [Pseudomonadota bacterium]